MVEITGRRCAVLALALTVSALTAGVLPGQTLKVERRDEGFVAMFGDGFARLELRGLRLVALGASNLPRPRLLPFQALDRDGEGWRLTAADDSEHEASVRLQPIEGGIEVVAVARIGLRTSVLEAACEYVWTGVDPLAWSRTPFLTPEEADVAPDVACPTPVAALGAARGGWAVLPVLAETSRRLPWFVACRRRDGADLLVHGRARYAVRGQRWFSLRGAASPALTGEEIRIAHTLLWIPGEDADRTFARLARRQWSQPAAARDQTSALADGPVRATVQAALGRAALGFVPMPRHTDLSFWLENPDEATAGTVTLAEDSEHRPLALACALAAQLGQERPEVRELARGLVRLFLAAPLRGGLFSTRVRIDLRSGAVQHLPGQDGTFRTRDCAEVARWLLRYGELDPELSQACLERARAVAEFLRRNQHSDGTLPGRFSTDHLDPVRDNLYQGCPDTLACGRLLLAMQAQTGDPAWRDAARACLLGVERALHQGSAVEPEASGVSLPAGRRLLLARTAIEGTMLAHELLAGGHDPAIATLADLWVDRLLPFQQCWSPDEFARDLRGGFARASHESIWSDIGAAEAAHALCLAWRRTGEAQLLERAAAAVQAIARTEGWGHAPRGEDLPWQPARQGLAQAASDVLAALDGFGDVIFDASAKVCYPLERCRARILSVRPDALALELETMADSPARMRLRLASRPASAVRITINGRDLGSMAPERLSEGVSVEARPGLRLGLRPPRLHDRRRDLLLRVEVGGAQDLESLQGTAELGWTGGSATVPLRVQGAGGSARLEALVPWSTWEDAAEIGLVVRAQEGERSSVAPASGALAIVLGDRSVADCGDDDERWLSAAEGTTIHTFPDGAGHGQRLGPGSSLAYELPIPAGALDVELVLRVAGSLDLLTGPGLVSRLRTPAGHEFFDHVVRLRERALWSSGELKLHVIPAPAGDLAWIRFRSAGLGATATEVGRALAAPPAKDLLHLRVLPLIVGEPPPVGRETLRSALFDDAASGSLASWVDRASRGRTRVQGSVERWRASPRLIETTTATSLARLAATALAAHGAGAGPAADVVLVLHTGAPSLVGLVPGSQPPLAVAPCPALTTAPFAADLGALLVLALTRAESVPQSAGWGFPEELQPAAADGPLRLPHPIGLQLRDLGWATLYEAALRDASGLLLPPVQEGGFLFALPGPELPGRGRWLIERRSDLPPGAGLLAYQELPPELPLRLVATGRPALRPRLLAVSASLPITTPHGEVAWQLQGPGRDPDPTATIDLVCGLRDLLATSEIAATTALPGRIAVPLPIGGAETQAGRVQRAAPGLPGLIVSPVGRAGGRLRLVLPQTLGPSGQRLSARLVRRGASEASQRLRVGTVAGAGAAARERWLLSTDLRPSEEAWNLVVTLPEQPAARLVLELETLGPGPCGELVLERLQASALTPPFLELHEILERSRPEGAGSARLSDGWIYGPVLALGEERDSSLDVPVSIPNGECRLRLQVGLPDHAPPGSERPISVTFREASGARVVTLLPPTPITAAPGPLPLFVIDLAAVHGRMGFLVISSNAVGPPLLLTIASIRTR